MMKRCALLVLLLALAPVCSRAAINLPPNRGTQLFLLMEAGGAAWQVVAIDEPRKWVLQTWNVHNPTYDFVLAFSKRTETGWNVSLTRWVMTDNYVPREERFEVEFPYRQQARYPFFDHGSVIGFYRNSVHDIDEHEFLPHESSNQAMERTADRSASTFEMTSTLPLRATRGLVRRRSSYSR
jgi:hypothetical protein